MVAIYTKHKYQERKICIFTNYRTGSTFLTKKISNLNNLIAFGEKFSYADVYHDFSKFDGVLEDILKKNKFVLKLMPDHLKYNDDMILRVLNSMDKVIYLYRRDFTAQAKSLIAAYLTDTFGFYGHKEMSNPINPIITVPEDFEDHVHTLTNVLKNNYIKMAEFYKKIPGELLCLEDFESQRPYQKTIVWPREPNIEFFDVESLFLP